MLKKVAWEVVKSVEVRKNGEGLRKERKLVKKM